MNLDLQAIHTLEKMYGLYNSIMSLYLLSIVISLDEEYILMHSRTLMNGIGVGGQN